MPQYPFSFFEGARKEQARAGAHSHVGLPGQLASARGRGAVLSQACKLLWDGCGTDPKADRSDKSKWSSLWRPPPRLARAQRGGQMGLTRTVGRLLILNPFNA